MNEYGVAVTAAIALAVIGIREYSRRSRRDTARASPLDGIPPDVTASHLEVSGGDGKLVSDTAEYPPFGQVLVLSARGRTKPNAVWERLCQYCDGRMPYVGLIVDVKGAGYHFSSTDLGGVVAAGAAWVRGWVAPCAIITDTAEGRRLQQLLRVAKLDSVQELRIVDSLDLARAHVQRCLLQHAG